MNKKNNGFLGYKIPKTKNQEERKLMKKMMPNVTTVEIPNTYANLDYAMKGSIIAACVMTVLTYAYSIGSNISMKRKLKKEQEELNDEK